MNYRADLCRVRGVGALDTPTLLPGTLLNTPTLLPGRGLETATLLRTACSTPILDYWCGISVVSGVLVHWTRQLHCWTATLQRDRALRKSTLLPDRPDRGLKTHFARRKRVAHTQSTLGGGGDVGVSRHDRHFVETRFLPFPPIICA